MKLMNLATSAIASLLSKRDYSVATCPSACYSICDEAQVLAEAVGYNYTALCSPGSAFMDGYASIQSCIAANTDSSTTDDFPELQQYVNYCNSGSGSQDTSSVTQVTSSVTQVTSSATQDTSSVTPETTQVPPTSTSSQTTYQASSASTVSSLGSLSSAESSISSVGSVLASAASYASSISMSEYAVTWCLYYSISHSSIAVNCTSSPAATTAPSTTVTSTPLPGAVTSLQPSGVTSSLPGGVASTRESHIGAIAGGVVGGVVGLSFIVLAGVLFWRRRRRRARSDHTDTPTEKAQLHADDIKPDRKELPGTEGSQELLEKKPAELAANEEVERNNLKELPSNEPPGHEMETTGNEMAVLDRMARLTDSTTLVSSSSRTNDTPEA